MYCKQCGKEIADNSVFCQHCGCKQDAKTTPSEKKIIEITTTTINLSDKSKKWLVIYGAWFLMTLIFLFYDEEDYYEFSMFLIYAIFLPYVIWGGVWLYKKKSSKDSK